MSSRERLRGHLGELACTAGLLASGLFITVYGLRYPLVMSDGVVGPGVMPLITGITLAAVTALVLARTISAILAAPDKEQPTKTDISLSDFSDEGDTGKPLTVAGILGMLVLSIVLSPFFGLIPMLALTMFVCVFVFERQSFVTALLMAIGGGISAWLLFVRLFEVPVPVGSFWTLLGL
jgi:hypothetical protein